MYNCTILRLIHIKLCTFEPNLSIYLYEKYTVTLINEITLMFLLHLGVDHDISPLTCLFIQVFLPPTWHPSELYLSTSFLSELFVGTQCATHPWMALFKVLIVSKIIIFQLFFSTELLIPPPPGPPNKWSLLLNQRNKIEYIIPIGSQSFDNYTPQLFV